MIRGGTTAADILPPRAEEPPSPPSSSGIKRKRGFRPFAIIAFILVMAGGLAYRVLSLPRITGLDPAVTEPGTVIVVRGINFGDERGGSRVLVDGVEPTRSSYKSWTSTAIELAIPPTVDSGLVRVHTERGTSNPAIFIASALLPVIPGETSAPDPSVKP